ncbi:DUF296 domain-containing protein [Streptomyces sp. NPDC020875]|uniref:PPC domain-containing DNA-binding protein n=1 Tax=Streptomyces sp. NPDC020875 TaxID=3154898 RepID=UPI0033F0B5EB
MRAAQFTTGRRFVLVMDHGEDFLPALEKFCAEHEVTSGHIPTLIGGLSHARLVGTCGPLERPEQPLWDAVEVEYLEAVGGGTLALDPATGRLAPHIHLSTGLKGNAAHARTSHLLGATVQFVAELVIEEIPLALTRPRHPGLFDVPLLTFDQPQE